MTQILLAGGEISKARAPTPKWEQPILKYLTMRGLWTKQKEVRKVKLKAAQFTSTYVVVYKRGFALSP